MSAIDERTTLLGYLEDLYLISDQVGMTDWERNFVADMKEKRDFSPKQKDMVLKLAEKYDV